MQSFHLACPFTSLPVCECRLYRAAAPRHARAPLLTPRAPRESTLRRALLLDILSSTRGPPGHSQAPCRALTRALFWRAMRGRLAPTNRADTLLASAVRAMDLEKEHTLVQVASTAARARERVDAARAEMQRVENKDARRDRADATSAPRARRLQRVQSDSDHNSAHSESDSEQPDDSDDQNVSIARLASRRASRAVHHKASISRRRR